MASQLRGLQDRAERAAEEAERFELARVPAAEKELHATRIARLYAQSANTRAEMQSKQAELDELRQRMAAY